MTPRLFNHIFCLMDYPQLKLKASGMKTIARRHPWIFSGAIEHIPDELENGTPVYLTDSDNIVATGLYSKKSMIAVRVMAFDKVAIDRNFIKNRLTAAIAARMAIGLGGGSATDGYRIVYGESDFLPGLVVDRYRDVIVMQISTAGMELQRDMIADILDELLQPKAIVEKSDLPSRHEEGLKPFSGHLKGIPVERAEFCENGRIYLADIAGGQKTGFYLDQRELRQEIYRLARGKKALDLFSYTGAAGMAALAGGATSVRFIDSSSPALTLCRQHARINGFSEDLYDIEETDVFQWLGAHSAPEYDLVMLDPPALIKSRKHLEAGVKAYYFLNRAALRIIDNYGILVTSSCSAYMAEETLMELLYRAAEETRVTLNILKTVHQSPDHPVPITFPEAAYLKSFICLIRRT